MKCKICGKEPKNLEEYVEAAKELGVSPEYYVRTEEGTFNPETEMFYCTACYIFIDMPLGTA